MTLMPQHSIRWCKACGRSFGTAYPGPMDCPYCTLKIADVSGNWPHVCSKGHGANKGGTCMECRVS